MSTLEAFFGLVFRVMEHAPPDRRYVDPQPPRLAVLSCYFNPCGYQAPLRNLLTFREHLERQGVPFFLLELAIGDEPFALPPCDRVVQRRSTSILFHKERLLNVLARRVPREFTALAWVDGDVVFDDPRWATAAEQALRDHPVVQLFETAEFLDRVGRVAEVRIGTAAAVGQGQPDPRNLGRRHPGFAWAARREWWERHGLFDLNVLGSGDSDIVCGLFGWWEHPHVRGYSPAMRRALLDWGHRVWHDVRGRVGWTPGVVRHLWHGSLADRRYAERWRALAHFEFEPERDVQTNDDGIWEWTGANPRFEQHVRDYFLARREDD